MGALLNLLLLFIVLVLFNVSTSDDLPANFVFGDSLVDVGNNNYLVSFSKANYLPNGIDFGRPTGRFTNGRTIVDIIGQELGMDLTPPYLAPTTVGPVILKGVNYASGGGGILNFTGQVFGGRLNFDAQIDNFANTRQDIIASIGLPAALNLLNMSLFSVSIGSNDFINNYLTPSFSFSERDSESPQSFVAKMISKFRLQLTRLFNLGARKVVVANVGPIGCIPSQRDSNIGAGDSCVSFPNQLAQLYNSQLKDLVTELNSNLEGSAFAYADVYQILDDILKNYVALGFVNPTSACCRVAGRYGGLVPCGPTSKVCYDRSKYVFWDPYHPTDAANVIVAKNLLEGGSNYIWPRNIRGLLQT
ncbi:GDSL esterase/lipase At4g16230-like [Vigna umbellata]|uniref:GDSL esterase/lipase At4g16230-like n=1 Tax=Vigna umbellata TaxID=87088 RepID=UPI001F5F47D8|nr:GDSL esterase/lipase At4g16230-like [Vigna umbellata]